MGNFPESLSHALLVGIMLVGTLGVSMVSERGSGAWQLPGSRTVGFRQLNMKQLI